MRRFEVCYREESQIHHVIKCYQKEIKIGQVTLKLKSLRVNWRSRFKASCIWNNFDRHNFATVRLSSWVSVIVASWPCASVSCWRSLSRMPSIYTAHLTSGAPLKLLLKKGDPFIRCQFSSVPLCAEIRRPLVRHFHRNCLQNKFRPPRSWKEIISSLPPRSWKEIISSFPPRSWKEIISNLISRPKNLNSAILSIAPASFFSRPNFIFSSKIYYKFIIYFSLGPNKKRPARSSNDLRLDRTALTKQEPLSFHHHVIHQERH